MAQTIPTIIADLEVQLSTAISPGGTTFSISSNTDDDGNSIPNGLYCVTVDNGSSNKEYLMGTLTGTDFTVVKSIDRQGGSTTGAVRSHRVGASVILTDFVALQRVADILRGVAFLDGTSPLEYDTEPSLSSGNQLATVAYVLDIVSGGTVAFDKLTPVATAGETIVAGNLVYFDTTDNEWKKTDADTSATVNGVKLGIAQGAGTDGNPISGGVLVDGLDANQSGMTPGDIMYASNTAGAISNTPGTNSRAIGIAFSATQLYFDPYFSGSLSSGQIDALAGGGDFGTPSSTNKFLTEDYGVTIGKASLNAGATINGATLPVPVYQNKSDNEVYACDGNSLTALKFLGFAITDSTDGNPIDVQMTGVVSGFTGLAEGEKYYLSDTAGTISNTIGTYEVLVGVAISETELLIQKGRRYASDAFQSTSTGDTVITVGFRASKITTAICDSNPTNGMYHGGWTVYGGNKCMKMDGTTSDTLSNLGDPDGTFTVSAVTDTTFTINRSSSGGANIKIFWTAEGEL